MKTLFLITAIVSVVYGFENPDFHQKMSKNYFDAKSKFQAQASDRLPRPRRAEINDPLFDAVLNALPDPTPASPDVNVWRDGDKLPQVIQFPAPVRRTPPHEMNWKGGLGAVNCRGFC